MWLKITTTKTAKNDGNNFLKQAENKGGSLLFGGQDGSTTKQYFAGISGVKESSTSGAYAGRMRFWTRPARDTPK